MTWHLLLFLREEILRLVLSCYNLFNILNVWVKIIIIGMSLGTGVWHRSSTNTRISKRITWKVNYHYKWPRNDKLIMKSNYWNTNDFLWSNFVSLIMTKENHMKYAKHSFDKLIMKNSNYNSGEKTYLKCLVRSAQDTCLSLTHTQTHTSLIYSRILVFVLVSS